MWTNLGKASIFVALELFASQMTWRKTLVTTKSFPGILLTSSHPRAPFLGELLSNLIPFPVL